MIIISRSRPQFGIHAFVTHVQLTYVRASVPDIDKPVLLSLRTYVSSNRSTLMNCVRIVRFRKNVPFGDGPAAGDQLLLRPVICGADVRPRGCREVALVSSARAAWAVAMQSAHARALLPALP